MAERVRNHLWVTGNITRSKYRLFHQHLLRATWWVKKRPEKKQVILVHIFSDGGDTNAGFAFYDLLRHWPVETVGIVEGLAHSAATYILLGCRRRLMRPSATFMIHEIYHKFSGRTCDQRVEMENSLLSATQQVEIYLRHSTLSEGQILRFLKDDAEWDAVTTLRYGFVHEIIRADLVDKE